MKISISLVDNPLLSHTAAVVDATTGKLYRPSYPVHHVSPYLLQIKGQENVTVTGPFDKAVIFSNGLGDPADSLEKIHRQIEKLNLSTQEKLNVAEAYREWSGGGDLFPGEEGERLRLLAQTQKDLSDAAKELSVHAVNANARDAQGSLLSRLARAGRRVLIPGGK